MFLLEHFSSMFNLFDITYCRVDCEIDMACENSNGNGNP